MDEIQLKKKFAELSLKGKEPFEIANLLFPENTNRALRVAIEWPTDTEVLKAQTELSLEGGEIAFLPTKADFCRYLWDEMVSAPFEDAVKFAKLYADTRGFIEKTPLIDASTKTQVNNVMIVRESESDDIWEEKALKQQERLISESSIN